MQASRNSVSALQGADHHEHFKQADMVHSAAAVLFAALFALVLIAARETVPSAKITLQADVSKSEAETYAKLSKLAGAEFDKAYGNEMVKDHEKDVAEFQKEAISGKDPSLKEFASKTLPTLQSHLQQARGMRGRFRLSRKTRIRAAVARL